MINESSSLQPTSSVMVPELHVADIDATDFTMIKAKLQDGEEGPGWSLGKCETVEQEYKRFLALKRAYPDKEIVPDRLVDTFWHQHILDTEKYAMDCSNLFGYFLHHYPYFGMQGAEDYANLCAAFRETRELYGSHFGPSSQQSDQSRCRAQCKPMKCR
jgi:hypothetical protein